MVEESRYEDRGAPVINPSTLLARVIVRQILEAGVTDVVISPGSRNAPLSIAFHQASTKGLINLHIRIDERTAAFFALGIAKASGRPVPIVCTSGTAVANYHPAVLEASHTNIPLLVLTADRPASMRKTGANQTTEQARIFGKAVRYFADVSGSVYPMELPFNSLHSGPVHLNIQFEEPLVGDKSDNWLNDLTISAPKVFDRKTPGTFYTKSTRGVLAIGHDRGGLSVEVVKDFAEKLGWPVIAEDPLTFESAISHASVFLTSKTIADDLAPDTVVVIGRTTLSRSINAFIKTARKQIVIDPRMATVDSDRMADQKFIQLPVVEVQPADAEWAEKWKKYSLRAQKMVADISTWSEQLVAREIAAGVPSGTSLFISSSRPIRDLEGFAIARTGVETFANRGLAGIDGNISTALGIASQRKETIAVLGDLGFLHDLTGLIHKEKINLKIFVINNDGGGIFSTLSQRGVDGFEDVFGTPHGLDPAAIATSMGISAKTIGTQKELTTELSEPVKGMSVVVVNVPNRDANADFLKGIYKSISSM
ncbi:2-succinyl-5-enolpyruvyl-6-hydroxy-3-cyclohexene-1-carboxylic-acid synthase [Candidatus Planktophila dulcis]|uniref:2-succinyl-5-enolpyruvyl-6-hydroxy-3- cyclohexene-1-carboxylic-acid synthase n=1 Tax=Candidatus Planktophila dulcis TaxID=1884914 RepID=UPI003CF9F1C4